MPRAIRCLQFALLPNRNRRAYKHLPTRCRQPTKIPFYNTKADLKSAENIADGSVCRTLGTDTYNDGKGHFYKIRELLNTDVIDDDNLLALNEYPTLVAEKMPDYYINELNEAIDELNMIMYAPLDPDGRDLKNLYVIIQENEMNDLMDENKFGNLFSAFYRLIDMEKKYFKNS